ncbi:MAG: acyl carrier protein [Psychroflexus sp.]|jgi:acyl carrier protein|nr:acyl carrier protein [Psychroflexus sp.]MDR9448386.1 acyl carrier protein [Psychroflexus sp.]
MSKANRIDRLKEIIKPYVEDADKLKDIDESTKFIDDLAINSAHLVDIILDVEDAFDIRIENDEMEQMLDVGAALQIIDKKTASS